jgi:predicted N-acetyltransferase YhbS
MPETMIHENPSPDDYSRIGELVREDITGLGFDVDFQDTESELADSSRHSRSQARGVALIATNADGQGIVRTLDTNVGQRNRMYVQPDGQGQGFVGTLCPSGIAEVRALGYRAQRQDSL